MVSPEDILRKARLLYPEVLRTHARGDGGFFPRVIPCRKVPDDAAGLGPTIAAVRRLKDASKERIGYGFTVQWREVNSRRFGRNLFPSQIVFETAEDFLRYVNKEREFKMVDRVVTTIRPRLPELGNWLVTNVRTLPDVASDIDGLLEVVDYLKRHPRPNLFARELPLSVDTKFIERHADLLRQWLDLVLPPHTIRSDEEHFERRYGLRYAEPHMMLRFLDDDVRAAFGFPCEVITVPLHTAEHWQIRDVRVLIVENKVNLLTLPRLPSTLAIGGLGNAVTLLRYCAWLGSVPITYWGDIDVQGFEILSRLRKSFPHSSSLLMDAATLNELAQFRGPGTGARPDPPPSLTPGESEAFGMCAEGNMRLEQERIAQDYVLRATAAAFGRMHGPASPD